MQAGLNISAPFVLLENTRDTHCGSYLFRNPVAEVICHKTSDVSLKLAELDQLRASGLYLCGYVAYEAAYGLADRQNFRLSESESPLIHFYAFRQREHLTNTEANTLIQQLTSDSAPVAIRHVQMNISEGEYCRAIGKVREHIRDGDSYQINYTLKYRFNYQGSALNLYSALRRSQSVEFAAFLNFPEYSVLSLSPELFIEKRGEQLISRPMKGTAARGTDTDEDLRIVSAMKADPKTLSENVMIVDLMRNDISRVAHPGTVAVEKLFEVQTFETLHQMVSTVKGEVSQGVDLQTLFTGLFPCGSITGAPKLRTMELIENLELEPRGVYTGAIGYISPDNDLCFNVPIRTCVAYENGQAEMGVGGGILFESDPKAEFDECRLKARFLTQLNSQMQLIESMRFDSDTGSIPLLEPHLNRLQGSAVALGFIFEREQILELVAKFIAGLDQTSKVRLLLGADGRCQLSADLISMSEFGALPSVDISTERTSTKEWLYQHKTTRRELYNRIFDQHAAQGAYDVLFINELGHISEASRHNIFIQLNDKWLTPPLCDAVLPGIYRQKFIDEAQLPVVESSFGLRQLLKAERIVLTNAVRGEVEVQLSDQAREQATIELSEAVC